MLSGISNKDTPEARSSSPCEAPTPLRRGGQQPVHPLDRHGDRSPLLLAQPGVAVRVLGRSRRHVFDTGSMPRSTSCSALTLPRGPVRGAQRRLSRAWAGPERPQRTWSKSDRATDAPESNGPKRTHPPQRERPRPQIHPRAVATKRAVSAGRSSDGRCPAQASSTRSACGSPSARTRAVARKNDRS